MSGWPSAARERVEARASSGTDAGLAAKEIRVACTARLDSSPRRTIHAPCRRRPRARAGGRRASGCLRRLHRAGRVSGRTVGPASPCRSRAGRPAGGRRLGRGHRDRAGARPGRPPTQDEVLADGGDRQRPDDRAGRGRERRRRVAHCRPGRRFERPAAGALPDPRLGERRLAGRRPHQARPLRRRRSGAARGRVCRGRRARARRVERDRRGSGGARRLPLRGTDGRRARLVRRRQVVPGQPAGGRGADGDRRPPRRRPGPSHDHEPPAAAPARRRPVPRHARHARAASLGLGRGPGPPPSTTSPPLPPAAASATAHTSPSPAAASETRLPTGRSMRSATRAGGGSRTSCAGWRSSRTPGFASEARKEWRRFARSQRKASW